MDRWEFEVNAQGGGNNESQYYTDRSENARIENGNLVIEARAENFTGPEGTRNYTSARLRTLNKGDWEYGTYRGRASNFPMVRYTYLHSGSSDRLGLRWLGDLWGN